MTAPSPCHSHDHGDLCGNMGLDVAYTERHWNRHSADASYVQLFDAGELLTRSLSRTNFATEWPYNKRVRGESEWEGI